MPFLAALQTPGLCARARDCLARLKWYGHFVRLVLMNKSRPVRKEAPSARPELRRGIKPSREQLVYELSDEVENLILSDAVFKLLQSIKKAIPIFYTFLKRERRRKKPSEHFRWLFAEAFAPDTPVDSDVLAICLHNLKLIRQHMEGQVLPPDTGIQTLRHLKNLAAIRKEPRYWAEYRAYRNGKQVSEILREFHAGYKELHGWEREKYFRKIYTAIQRLVEKYGGPALNKTPRRRRS